MGIENIRNVKKNKPAPTLYIRKVADKRKAAVAEESVNQKKDDEFLRGIWNKKDHVCYECGCQILGMYKKLYMDHALEKADYPEYRYLEENINIVCHKDHDQKSLDIEKTPRLKAYREQLLEKLLNHKP